MITGLNVIVFSIALVLMLSLYVNKGGAPKVFVRSFGLLAIALFVFMYLSVPEGNFLPEMSGTIYFVMILVLVGLYGALFILSPAGKLLISLND
ncbi:MAG: hypothetical protein AAF363_17415 [Bacteroidota bacterium]